MKNSIFVMSVVAGMGILTGAMYGVDKLTEKDVQAPAQEMQFVCLDDGKIVEQQIGVEKAFNYHNSAQVWYIKYVDSDIIVNYHQPMGETCFVEEVK